MNILRKTFFYLFIALYLVICPLIILRMSGFVISPSTHNLVKTGLIYVSTNPPGADVFINGRLAHEKTPAVIRDLVPGEHFLRLSMKGYKDWTKRVPLVAKKATSVENILMIPSQWAITVINRKTYQDIIPVAANHLLVSQGDNIDDILVDDNIAQELFNTRSIYHGAQILRYFTVDQSPFLIVQIRLGDKDKYLWIDLREKQTRFEDITDLLPQEPQQITWEATNDKSIYTLNNGAVNRLDIKTKAIYTNILTGVRNLVVESNNLYILNNESHLARYDLEGQNKKIIPLDFPETISGYTIDTEHKNILIWTPSNIAIVYYAGKIQLQWLPLATANITQAFWANNGSSIIILKDDHISLLDKENFSRACSVDIAMVKPKSRINFIERNGKLYYLDMATGLLSSVQVVHHKPFIPKPIAQTLRLRQFER